jgi:hypothetical protein
MEAIGTLESHAWEKKENPQAYDLLKQTYEHPRPSQHMLGIVGGNEVPYNSRPTQVDVESDLRGITRPNTFCPSRQHKPSELANVTITRNSPQYGKVSITPCATPLKQSQMWAYPATLAPEPLTLQMCVRPEKQ